MAKGATRHQACKMPEALSRMNQGNSFFHARTAICEEQGFMPWIEVSKDTGPLDGGAIPAWWKCFSLRGDPVIICTTE
ncbi:hypothetical protein NC653_019435 [Populus alba x Populus x berolinensis]|uniref:Uncharacterized protein n=1 Tax=Populus alba x Populus x berolinensis TaxID=444605 RepID=A0AAD6QIW5_9ROSI|nr:hypothetical protein NC653_019435 [Populus alba x Populus x berolinensis]